MTRRTTLASTEDRGPSLSLRLDCRGAQLFYQIISQLVCGIRVAPSSIYTTDFKIVIIEL